VSKAAAFIGGALLGGRPHVWVSTSLGWGLARLLVTDEAICLQPTVKWLFRERRVARADVEFVASTRIGVLVQSEKLALDGFVFCPLPFQRRNVLAALEYWQYPIE
jgi:hypothetical protein